MLNYDAKMSRTAKRWIESLRCWISKIADVSLTFGIKVLIVSFKIFSRTLYYDKADFFELQVDCNNF